MNTKAVSPRDRHGFPQKRKVLKHPAAQSSNGTFVAQEGSEFLLGYLSFRSGRTLGRQQEGMHHAI